MTGKALEKAEVYEGQIVLDKLDEMLPADASDVEIAEFAADRIRERIAHAHAFMARGADMLIEAGAYLCAAKQRLGSSALPAICDAVGIGRAAAYNYMNFYKFRDKKFIRSLDPGKAFQAIRFLSEPGVTVDNDNIIITEDGESVTLTLDEVNGMTLAQFTTLAQAVKAKDKKLKAADVYATKLEKDVKSGNEKIAALQKQINEILGSAEKDPMDKLFEDANKCLMAFGRMWTKVLTIEETDLNEHQQATLEAIDNYMATLATARERGYLLVNGTSIECADGQYYFDTDHPKGDGNTYSNLITGSGTTLANLQTAFISARNAIVGSKRLQIDADKPVRGNMPPDTIVTPSGLLYSLRALFDPNTKEISDGVPNLVKGLIKLENIIEDPALTDANDWYVLSCGDPDQRPFLDHLVTPYEMVPVGLNPNSESDVRTERRSVSLQGYIHREVYPYCWFHAAKVTTS